MSAAAVDPLQPENLPKYFSMTVMMTTAPMTLENVNVTRDQA
jgi:hypothetical protein